MKKQAIGIFDSGVGGLTVFREIRKQFPSEDLIYFGDTARVPYGPKSKNTVIDYSLQNTRFLTQQNVKMIIIACNTSSAVALDVLRDFFDVPILGVIEPGSRAAVKATKTKRIGVIATEGTVRSKAYSSVIKSIDSEITTFSKACPLFVSLAEEGWENHPVTYTIAKEYLTELLEQHIDTLVLGCTHYPILKDTIQSITGQGICLVDSAVAITEDMRKVLPDPQEEGIGTDLFFVSDNEDKFKAIASRILPVSDILLRKVRLGESWYIDYQ